MSEEFNVNIKFRMENEASIEFLRTIGPYFERQRMSNEILEEMVSRCPVEINEEQHKKLVPKKYKNSLGYALAETGLECNPNLLSAKNMDISELKVGRRGFYVIEAYGSDSEYAMEFCKYFMVLLLLLGASELSGSGQGAGWEATWSLKNGKIAVKKQEYDL